MSSFLQTIELLAVISASIYGVLLARRKGMDLVGVTTIAFITAFGGGTIRDLFLDRHPLFWIRFDHYPIITFVLAIITCFFRRIPRWVEKWLVIPDTLGLGLFAIAGCGAALQMGTSWFIASLLGVVTGTFGGVIGDVVCNEVPSLFRSAPLYATCAFAGCWVFMALSYYTIPDGIALWTGIAVIVSLRFCSLRWNWHLPEHTQS